MDEVVARLAAWMREHHGVVQAINAPGKVTIQFADQRRVLVAKKR